MINNTNIDALLINKEGYFSLQDSLVLAIPGKNASPLYINGFYFECDMKITEQSLFVLSASELEIIQSKEWSFYTILISEIIEILAVVDTAIGKSFLSENESFYTGKINKNIIEANVDLSMCHSIKNVIIDLVIKNDTNFNLWCNVLRRYEAYGIMRFLLSAVEKDRNANINQLCK
ncbi:hypothetical protein [Providencia sneebia]|uniref:AraC family transcription regulator n=1 Tax=Providencia sneebia DSM 19967 TaxID=1141660 RepID=K8WLR6_9GAMM|nr:hypothetical protein [Providencia sneebia]EKT60886.1 AraC family transcription regulator [Providencia sneebia DSM 19967]